MEKEKNKIKLIITYIFLLFIFFSYIFLLIHIIKNMATKLDNIEKENQNLKTEVVSLINKNNELKNELKSKKIEKNNTNLEFIKTLESQDKQEYLKMYKEIIKDMEDLPETIYDYTTNDEFILLCKVVQAESGICDFDGKVNVATTIINRYFDDNFPNDWNEIIFQKNQYSPILNDSYLKQKITTETIDAIEYAFLFGSDYVKDATYFHSKESSWHKNNLDFIYYDGWHSFYKEKNNY